MRRLQSLGVPSMCRVVRFPASAPASLKPGPTPVENPFYEAPAGPLAVPGTYSVSFEKRVDGALTACGERRTFQGESPGPQTRKAGDATGAKELRKGDQQVDGKDEDFTHWADRTITAGTRKTARRVRIDSHCEFATHWSSNRLSPP